MPLEAILVSIVIPAYNEQERISLTLNKIQAYMKGRGLSYEIIVVDDGSTDNTAKLIEAANHKNQRIKLIMNGVNKGKGYSVKNGFMNASGQYLLFSDADLSTPIEEMEKLIAVIDNGFDGAVGSRGLEESDIQIHQPWYRETMGKIFNILVRSSALKGFKDTQCGFKCFARHAALEICNRQKIERFSFDVEMLYIAKKLGYRVKEVPVRWLNSPQTKVSAIKDSAKMFVDLLKIRIHDLLGKYN